MIKSGFHGRGPQPGCGVLRLEHGISVKLEAGAKKAPYLCFVIDDKYFSHRTRPQAPACPRNRRQPQRNRRAEIRALRFPHELPPLAAMKVLAIQRPRPDPDAPDGARRGRPLA